MFDSGGICGVCLVTLLSGCVLDCVVDFMHECVDFKGMFSRVVKDSMGRLVDIQSVVCVRTYILIMICDLREREVCVFLTRGEKSHNLDNHSKRHE